MPETKIAALKKEEILSLIKLSAFVLMATVAPMFRFQEITGPIVNAILYLSVIFIGFPGALFVAFFPSAVSLATGHLPFSMIPMIPFIMIGNLVLMMSFNQFKKNYWTGVLIASFLKFIFLFISGQLIFTLIDKKLLILASGMMGWMQFFTALAGGLIAYMVLRFVNRNPWPKGQGSSRTA